MKSKNRWKLKLLIWLRDEGWIWCGLIVVFGLIGVMIFNSHNSTEKESIEEKLRIEEFTYKGHQYIKFRGHDALGTFSVLHDPNCVCQTKRDSI